MSVDKRLVISRRLEDPNGVLDKVVDSDEVEMEDALRESIEIFRETDVDMSFIMDMIQSEFQTKAGPTSVNNSPAQFLQIFSELSFTLRAEEQQYLRQPLPGERECARGLSCEARNIYCATGPVTLVEHMTAQERQDPPAKPSMCVMCKRTTVNWTVINMIAEGTDMSKLFHSHCNYVNTVGEYALDQCLMAGRTETHGVLAPIVAHCRFYYTAFQDTKLGIVRFAQSGYKTVF